MKFGAVYCFSEVEIVNSYLDNNKWRMSELRVIVVDEVKGEETRCGYLRPVKKGNTVEDQTYR